MLLLLAVYLYFARSAIWGLPAEVVSVIDGDTIKVVFRCETNNVRLLGIDCLETRHTKKQKVQAKQLNITVYQVAEIGKLSTARARELLPVGCKIRLVFHRAKIKKDYFRRYLAYVEVDGKDIGEILLTEGLAYIYETQHPRKGQYQQLRIQAETSGIGLWVSQ